MTTRTTRPRSTAKKTAKRTAKKTAKKTATSSTKPAARKKTAPKPKTPPKTPPKTLPTTKTTGTARTRPAPPRARLTRAARAQQLLDVAERLITTRGFGETSMEDIARAAGVTRPIVYAHFGDHDGVLLACAARARAQLEDGFTSAVTQLPADADIGSRLAAGGDVFFAMLEANPRRWLLLFSTTGALKGRVARALVAQRLRTIRRIADVARASAPDVDDALVLAVAHAISGVGEQLGRWWLTSPKVSRSEVVGLYRAFILGGIEAMQRSPSTSTFR